VFTASFCKSQFTHESVNFAFIVTKIKKEQVDEFVRELTFSGQHYEGFERNKISDTDLL